MFEYFGRFVKPLMATSLLMSKYATTTPKYL